MNFADAFYEQFLQGKLAPKEFLLLQLRANDTNLSKFLYKQFFPKKIKIKIDDFLKDKKHIICYGKDHEWWLVANDKFNIEKDIKSKSYKVDYYLTIANERAIIVAIKVKK